MKDILLGIGLGKISFGMTREQVSEIIGQPDEIDKFSYTDSETELTESWHFDELELSGSFDEDDNWRLGMLSASSPDFELKGHKMIGMELDKVLEILSTIELGEMKQEDWTDENHPNHKLVTFDDYSLNLWFDTGLLAEIQWGVLWKDEETQVWPK